MPRRSPASRRWSSCWRPAPTPTSSSMSGWSASGATTSTSTSTRSRPLSRRPSSRSASATGRSPALTEGPLPSPDTIAGAFIRDLEARIAELEAAGSTAEAAEQRDALRLGRLLLGRPRGLPVRIRKLSGRDFRRYRELRHRLRTRADGHPRPERGRQDDHPARARARPDPPSDEHGGGARGAPAVGCAAGSALDHHRRIRAGRARRPEGRHPREDVRRLEGDGPPRLRRPVDHGPEPGRPGDGRADRHPDRGLLPLDRLGPSFRAERPVA